MEVFTENYFWKDSSTKNLLNGIPKLLHPLYLERVFHCNFFSIFAKISSVYALGLEIKCTEILFWKF